MNKYRVYDSQNEMSELKASNFLIHGDWAVFEDFNGNIIASFYKPISVCRLKQEIQEGQKEQ